MRQQLVMSRRDKFPGLEGEELFDGDLTVETSRSTFDPNRYRAFGSVPKLLGKEISLLDRERIDEVAWQRTDPVVIRSGLFSREGGTAVNGLVLGAGYYEAIIRNQGSFLSSVQAKTVDANRQVKDPRATEKMYHSMLGSLRNKSDRHEKIIGDLSGREQTLARLADMQRTPGYHRRVSEAELRVMATTAWESVFTGMLTALKDQYELSSDEMINMQHAMAYRLLHGDGSKGNQQAELMAGWGAMLGVGRDYTHGLKALFSHSQRKITARMGGLETDLEEHRLMYQLPTVGTHAVSQTVDVGY